MAEAASQGAGVALLPPALFAEAPRAERLVQPFDVGVGLGSYWLTRLKWRPAPRRSGSSRRGCRAASLRDSLRALAQQQRHEGERQGIPARAREANRPLPDRIPLENGLNRLAGVDFCTRSVEIRQCF
jgi:hypothetical protein